MTITPTPAQMNAIVDIVTTERPVTRLHGYAGTGKTSAVATEAIRAMQRQDRNVQVLAPTGKAAKVLRAKGLHGAQTIHSYLYTPSKRERQPWRDQWEEWKARMPSGAPADVSAAIAAIDEAMSETPTDADFDHLQSRVKGKLRDRLERLRAERRFELTFMASGAIAHYEENGSPAAEVLLIDEASMVSSQVSDDLERTGSRLVFVGDPAQLPPVKANRSRAAMGEPHHLLTEVHRQRGGSPVLELATQIRESAHPSAPPTKRKHLGPVETYDQVLCWRNATREHVNGETRRRLGRRRFDVPEAGDRLVCLKNTKPVEGVHQWMNGEQATVLEVGKTRRDDAVGMTVQDDEGAIHDVTTELATFGGYRAEQTYLDRSGWTSPDPVFAFGYALTVHKAQGSEWPRVLLVDESADLISVQERNGGRRPAVEQARQWLYTGITRARDELHVVRSLTELPRG